MFYPLKLESMKEFQFEDFVEFIMDMNFYPTLVAAYCHTVSGGMYDDVYGDKFFAHEMLSNLAVNNPQLFTTFVEFYKAVKPIEFDTKLF